MKLYRSQRDDSGIQYILFRGKSRTNKYIVFSINKDDFEYFNEDEVTEERIKKLKLEKVKASGFIMDNTMKIRHHDITFPIILAWFYGNLLYVK